MQVGRWISAQIGAREHYAVPRALHSRGQLAGFYTDYWASPSVRKLGKPKAESGTSGSVFGGLRSLAGLTPEARRAMGAKGRAYVLAHHTYPVLARRFADAMAATRPA